MTNSINCLSKRNVVSKYRNGIKWNLSDELCIDVRVVTKEIDEEKYKISGYIFSLQ